MMKDNNNQFSRYLKFISYSFPLFLLLIIVFNRLMNPFGLYDSPSFEGINVNKPAFSNNVRMTKAAIVRHIKPTAIILGSSRGEFGIDPEHPGWSSQPVYNLSLSGGNIYEAYRYLQHSQAIQPLSQVVIMIDFFMFNQIGNPDKVDFEEKRLSVNIKGDSQSSMIDTLASLLSIDAFIASIKIPFEQEIQNYDKYKTNGMRIPTIYSNYVSEKGHRNLFQKNEHDYYVTDYKSFTISTENRDNWQIYQQLLMLAHQNNIDLRIAISPSHARQFEVISIKGLWPIFEDWKHQLVTINETVALNNGSNPFALWDFSDYNSLTTEEVPALDDNESEMQWYWESSHFKKELGDLVLDRIFDQHDPDRDIAIDFGVLLTPNNIKAHLQQSRYNRQKWRSTHPEDIKEISSLVSAR